MSSKLTDEERNLLVAHEVTGSAQHVELASGSGTTFYGKEGRNYLIALTNMDDSYIAKVGVFDMEFNNRIATLEIEPLTAESVVVEMGLGNGVRVYNESDEKSSGRPFVNASCYHA